MIRGRSRGRVEVALAHNESCCVIRADDPYVVASVGRRQVSGITRSQGREVMHGALWKAVGPLGFSSIYRPARASQTRSSAGIVSTHPLTAVAPACGTGTGLGTLPVQFGGHLAAALSVALDPVLVKHPAGFNCIVGQELTTPCGTLYLRRSGWQSDKATAKAYVGEELSV